MNKKEQELIELYGKLQVSADGTITVNAQTLRDIIKEEISIEKLKEYPVGSIYTSTSSTNPSEFIGGQWEQITDKFLLAAGSTYSAGSTGGTASVNYTPQGTNTGGAVQNHTLTVNEMPSHNHDVFTQGGGGQPIKFSANGTGNDSGFNLQYEFIQNFKNSYTIYTREKGGGQAHNHGFTQPTFTGTQATLNNMPPYLTVYVWKRIS